MQTKKYKTYFLKLAPYQFKRKIGQSYINIVFKDKVQVTLDDKVKCTQADLVISTLVFLFHKMLFMKRLEFFLILKPE